MDWYLEALKKYAVVAGRASRREYWSFVLLSVLISLVLTAIDLIIGRYDEARGVGPLSSLFTLAMLLPLLLPTGKPAPAHSAPACSTPWPMRWKATAPRWSRRKRRVNGLFIDRVSDELSIIFFPHFNSPGPPPRDSREFCW